jgi:hypothetical protein
MKKQNNGVYSTLYSNAIIGVQRLFLRGWVIYESSNSDMPGCIYL